MKQFKRIFILVVFFALGGIFNLEVIKVSAKETEDVPQQLDYYIIKSQNILYYDYLNENGHKILQLLEVERQRFQVLT
jgi:hypothetical protein